MATMELGVRCSIVWGRMDTVALKVGRRVIVGLVEVRRRKSAGVWH